MIADRVTVASRSAWTHTRMPPDMHHVEVWHMTTEALAYRDGGVWKDAVTGLVLEHSADVTHWREVWSPAI